MNSDNRFEEYDQLYETWKAAHPGKTFSDFSVARVYSSVKKGTPHPTLGPNLAGKASWATAGQSMFETLLALHPLPDHSRICDYGCGSLRIAHHFIRRQEPGCVMAVDMIPHFIRMGKELIGEEILREKQPRFCIRPSELDGAINFGADLVYAISVARHVHPEEKPVFLQELLALSSKPGCVLILEAWLDVALTRFERSGWAWPISHYTDGLSPLQLKDEVELPTGMSISATKRLLVFVRP